MKKWFLVFVSGLLLLAPHISRAQLTGDIYSEQLKAGAAGAGFASSTDSGDPTDPRLLAASLLNVVLGMLGSVFIGLIVLAGYRLLKADGDSSKIEQGYATMRMAIIGIIIILASYSVSTFVVKSIISSINGADSGTGFNQ